MAKKTAHPPLLETIRWYSVDERLPDAEITVLLHIPSSDNPIEVGYLDGDDSGVMWFRADCAGAVYDSVTHWADLPVGPGGGR